MKVAARSSLRLETYATVSLASGWTVNSAAATQAIAPRWRP